METICLETRQKLVAEPNTRNSELLDHLSNCESCAEFLQKLKTFDDKLDWACRLDVPEGLESRIILAQRMASTADDNVVPFTKAKNKTSTGYKWMSMAAALVLAVGLSFGMFKLGESNALQNDVLAHIESHIYELEKDDNIQLASLNKMLEPHGLRANDGIGYIRHVSNCPIEGKMVPHLVVSDDEGRVYTIMYIPWKDSEERSLFNDEKYKGVLVGAQKGSFAIVADAKESLETIENRVINSMEVKI